MQTEDLKQAMALEMMRRGGYDPEHPEKDPIEWDLSRTDSQYSICLEEASHLTDFLLIQLMSIPSEEAEDDVENERLYEFDVEEEEESMFDEYGHLRRDRTVTTSASLFIFMDAGTGKPRYVSDVREWLEKVDKAGIPDDTEIEGQLYLDYDLDGVIETIECGECGNKDMLISTCGH